MATPIEYQDIKPGDRVRQITEYTVPLTLNGDPKNEYSYELVERYVPLPTKAGWYKTESKGVRRFLTLDEESRWYDINGYGVPANVVQQTYQNLVLMRKEGELVEEVLKEVRTEYQKYNATTLEQDLIVVGRTYNIELSPTTD